MDPNYNYMGYRLALILSEVLGGETLVSCTLHWKPDRPIFSDPGGGRRSRHEVW